MNQIILNIHTPEEMIQLGKTLVEYAYPNLVLALVGDLGAGKTTLTKGIGEALGIQRVINSPTFTIMKTYDTKHDKIQKLYHLDVYRLLDSQSDFELEEYFYLDGLTVIEWARIIADLLPPKAWEVEIKDLGNQERQVKITADEIVVKAIGEKEYEIVH